MPDPSVIGGSHNYYGDFPLEARRSIEMNLTAMFQNGRNVYQPRASAMSMPTVVIEGMEKTALWQGRLGRFTKWVGARKHSDLQGYAKRFRNFKFDLGWTLTQDDLEDDAFGILVPQRNRELVRRGMELPDHLLSAFLLDADVGDGTGAGTLGDELGLEAVDFESMIVWPSALNGGDGQPFFDDSHTLGAGTYDNIATIDPDSLTFSKDLWELVIAQNSRPSDRGGSDIESFPVTHIITGVETWPQIAFALRNGAVSPDGTITPGVGVPNVFSQGLAGITLIHDPNLDASDKFFLLDQSAAIIRVYHRAYPGGQIRTKLHDIYDRDALAVNAITRLGYIGGDPRAATQVDVVAAT